MFLTLSNTGQALAKGKKNLHGLELIRERFNSVHGSGGPNSLRFDKNGKLGPKWSDRFEDAKIKSHLAASNTSTE